MARRRSDPSLEIPIELASSGELVIPPALSGDPIGRIGRYDVLGRIAVGGMAEIYLAREDAAGVSRFLVVKVVRPQLADDTDFGEMFLHEGRVALSLKHPNICHVYEFGVDGRRYFIAMEYVHGTTLREAIRRAASRGERLPIAVVARVVAQVAEALDSAHRTRDHGGRMGVVHRDVTPRNIMVGFDGIVKLVDFGIAQAQGDPTRGDQTRIEGKLAYLAPEQIRKRRVDGRSDIYSLGVCLYEALTGKPLFRRKTDLDTLKAVLEEPVPEPRVELPEALVAIARRALEKDPAARFQTAREMEQALSKYLLDSRELVSTTRVAEAMAALFEDEIKKGPVLDRSDGVVAQLRAGAPDATRSRRRTGGVLIGAVAVVGLAAVVWAILPSVLPSERAPDPLAADGIVTSQAPPTEPRAIAAPAAEVDAGVAPAEERAVAPDAGLEAADEEAGDGDRARKRRRVRTQGGFVVDPDF